MASKTEINERTDMILLWISQGQSKGQIKQLAKTKWDVSARTVERSLVGCRKLLLKEIDESREVLVANSISYYRNFLTDPKASEHAKLRARERMDKILGLDAPLKHELTGKDGKPIQTQTIDPAKATEIAGDPELAGHAEALGVAFNLPTGKVDEDKSE